MTSAAILKIEQRWQLPFWSIVTDLAEQGLNRADSARALGLKPHSLRYHLAVHPDLDPFPPVVHPPRDYAADTGETFREACVRMSATHTLTQAAREIGYADSSCFKRALRARGLNLEFQKHKAKPRSPRLARRITVAHVELYAELRLSGVMHEDAAGRVGFSDCALRNRLQQLRPELWLQVKRLGRENSRTRRQAAKGRALIWFSDEQIQRLCASYKAGATIDALGAEYGISAEAVRYRLRANGVKIRPKGPARLTRNEMLLGQINALKAMGWTIAQICGKLGMSPTTFYRRLSATPPAASC